MQLLIAAPEELEYDLPMTRISAHRLLVFVLFIAVFSAFTQPAPALPPKPAVEAAAHKETAAQKRYRLARNKVLSKTINAILAQPEVARAFWGIDVVSLETGQTIFSINADKLFTPASNTKLFTAVTAMTLLGPDYREKTTVEASGNIDSYGRLEGDLVLVGRGDPNLSGRVLPYHLKTERTLPHLQPLEDLADQVVKKGLKEVEGDIVGDDSYFAFERFGSGWSEGDLLWDYGAPVSALTVNDNVMFLKILPGASVGDKAYLTFDPENNYYVVDNRITTVAAGTGPRNIGVDRQPGSRTLTLWGTMPLDDTGDSFAIAIDDPAEFAAQAFRDMLVRRGVKIKGKVRAQHALLASIPLTPPDTLVPGGGAADPSEVLPGHTVLASRDSAPLAQDLQVIAKVSQNLHAEIALRLAGRAKGRSPTLDSALDVLRGVLTQAGIEPDEYSFTDGSGLSRDNLVTPQAVVKLLQFADAQPWAQQFQDMLPVAGVDGTLRFRFVNSPAVGHIFAKTGTLGHVNALSGYATTLEGHRLAFSMFTNHHKLTSRGAEQIMDQIMEAVVNDAPPPKKHKRARKPAKSKPH